VPELPGLILSARACDRVLKVSRTNADLEWSDAILPDHHFAEAAIGCVG
jgi:predicted ATPase with chaperone activity